MLCGNCLGVWEWHGKDVRAEEEHFIIPIGKAWKGLKPFLVEALDFQVCLIEAFTQAFILNALITVFGLVEA